jgi:alkaline phosphatase D
MVNPKRRQLLARSAALAAAAWLHPSLVVAQAGAKFKAYPFTLGVASGSPTTQGFVLWTRIAPDPLAVSAMDPAPVDVQWEVAHDEKFARIVKRGTATAEAEHAHAVHVEIDGLDPARGYYYRFLAGGEASGVGRARTAPAPGHGDDKLRFAFASCQQFEQGWFSAYRHLVNDAPDLVVFLGDYIYESSWGREHVRKHASTEPITLDEYRDRYGQYKTDADLQAAHASCPWIVTWDDHEVDNDYANDRGEDLMAEFLARRTAAYRAFFEHHPLPRSVLTSGGMRIFDRHAWGSLALFHVLDDRQYRSWQVCTKPNRGGSNVVGADCTERLDEKLTLLGPEQERWLDEGFAQSKAKWNVIAQQTLMAPAGRMGPKGLVHWTDGWDGYPAARQRLMDSIVAHKPANPVVISGDVHASYVANLRAQSSRGDSPVVAAEFCGTSITSQGPDAKRVQSLVDANPDVRFGEGSKRGYVLVNARRDRMVADYRVVDTVKTKDAGIATLASFTVEAGKAGLA